MIVLDEQLIDPQIVADIQHWYKGTVTTILDLRPHTQIDDSVFISKQSCQINFLRSQRCSTPTS
jgi:hypothetical protein